MEIKTVDVETLTTDPNNARTHDARNLAAIQGSLNQFGQVEPLVVQASTGKVIGGNGRLEVMRNQGQHTVEVVEVDVDDQQAAALGLALNRTAELAEWDIPTLAELTASLDDVDLDALGFSAGEIGELLDEPVEEPVRNPLVETFVVPPVSVLDSRQGYWMGRKKYWRALIQDNGETREGALGGMSEVNVMRGINSGVSLLDPVLAELIVRWFGMEGGRCADPFAGDTVFGYVAAALGNTFTGIEIRKEQADANNQRTPDSAVYHCDDGQNVGKYLGPETQDLIFSCPPYYDLEQYSDLPQDASNQGTYEEFLEIVKNALGGAVQTLKQNRFAVVVIGDVRCKDGQYRGLPGDMKAIMEASGALLYNELILVEPLGTLPQRVRRYMRNRKVGKCHQQVLVFYKGDPKSIKTTFPEVSVNEGEDME